MLILFSLGSAVGIVAPVFRERRGILLVACACLILALMAYSYQASTPEALGQGSSTANRQEAVFAGACEMAVVGCAALSLRRTAFFWVGWTLHTLLAAASAVIVIWLEFFWHW